MNRPRRRQGGLARKAILVVALFLALGGVGYAVWHFDLVGSAWTRVAGLTENLFGGSTETAAATTAAPSGGVRLDVAAAEQAARNAAAAPTAAAAASLRPTAPVPAPEGPISVAIASTPASAHAVPSAPAAPGSAASAPAAPAASVRPAAAVSSAAGGPPEAIPVLSDAKAQLRAVDQMLASNPAEALRRLEELKQSKLTDEEASETGYRLGYAARMLRDEEKAEKSWRETADAWPSLRGGRFSALALGDTWYQRYAGERPQQSYWDDIQVMYSRALGRDDAPFLPDTVKAGIKERLRRLNDALFFGPAPTKLARYHKVQSGELLGSIANKYRVDYDSIARINNVNPNRIGAGLDLKLVVGDVSIVVRKNTADPKRGPTVTWYLDDRWMREYPACVGDGMKTPAGTYKLTSKEKDPSWTNPLNGQLLPNNHPDNILGSRWMAMKGMNTQGLGIHGTTVDDSIPGYTSAGCVRLLNRDVEELFSFSRIDNMVTILE